MGGVGRGSERKVGGEGEKERERFKIVHQSVLTNSINYVKISVFLSFFTRH